MEKTNWKQQKKAYKKAKHLAIRPWKGMSIFFGILSVVMIGVFFICSTFDNTLAAFTGGTFWKLENEDPDAVYYTSDFDSVEEMVTYGEDLCRRVEAEGAALLMNENNALPLKKGAKVSTFSNSSVNPVYGGTGSGNIDASAAETWKDALENAGLSVNETLWDFYATGEGAEYMSDRGGVVTTTGATTSEVPWSAYTDEVKKSVASYGDAALVMISRVGGEGADATYQGGNYLALDDNEKDMLSNIAAMKKEGTIKKTVLLINSANALQVDFLKDNTYDIDAVLWIGDVGINGIGAVADIIRGNVNPSGSLVDTYCYDNYSSPAMANFTPIQYEGYEEGIIPDSADTYMIYQEGIYMGYKYYETRYEDVVMQTAAGGNKTAGDYVYGDNVAFPFGYGLSYTTFAYSNFSVSMDEMNHQYHVNVSVTNTGDRDGKETVQVYVQSPYTEYDIENKVEKASVSLCGFAKTKELAPGETQELEIIVDGADIASYDAYGSETYIMDAGTYYFTAATDAHNAVNNILTAKGYSMAQGMDGIGDGALVGSWNNPTLDTTTYAVAPSGAEITNQLSDSDLNLYEGTEQKVTYLSRNDWEGTWPKETVKIELTEQLIDDLQLLLYDSGDYGSVEMPVMGAEGELTLYDMIGLDYEDPQWDTLLDQMTFDEMVALIGDSFHWTMPVESVQAPGSRDENGPQGLTASLFNTDSSEMAATAFTSEDVMAATFNRDLMTEIGKVIGNNCLSADVAVLYGPGNNIHRVPFGGRNFEYYSEDGFLSGEMSKYEVAAIESKGVHVVMKHFALNDCEQDRIGLGVWLNEQAAREIYLKAFQAPIEEGNGGGVMVAYTRWGAIWSGADKGLMSGILRDEWGSEGLTITDNVLTKYVNGVDGIMAGGVSTFDAMLPYVIDQLPEYENDPVVVTAMRNACHHNLYALANSVAMNGVGENTLVKAVELHLVVVTRILMVISILIFLLSLVLFIRKKMEFKKTEAYKTYISAKKDRKQK